MDVITQRRCLTAVAGGLLAGAVGAIGWTFSALPDPPPPPQASMLRGTPSPAEESARPAFEGDSQMLALSLRRPLVDPPPQRQTPPPPPPPVVRETPPRKPLAAPKLEFTLLGTIIDSQRRLAIIADPTGNFDIKGVGETLELSPLGVAIEQIESDQVTLTYEGQQTAFHVDKTRKAGTVRGPNPRGRIR